MCSFLLMSNKSDNLRLNCNKNMWLFQAINNESHNLRLNLDKNFPIIPDS